MSASLILLSGCPVLFFKQKTAYEMRISDWSSDVCSSDLDGRCSRCRQLILGEAGCRDREVAPQHLREQVLRCLDQGHLVRRPPRKKSHLVAQRLGEERPDRQSTRLNSSH